MLVSKCIVPFFVLCCAHESLSKPTTSYITEGRGIGSTLWGWITYPFSWWGSVPEQPITDQLVGPAIYGPYDNIEIGKRNVTLWCNDQTCTTMKCDRLGCKNITCNIYDTDMTGECREYNTVVKPEEAVPPKPAEPTNPTLQDKVTVPTKAPEVTSVAPALSTIVDNQSTDVRPLELEAVLSSTVTEGNGDIVVSGEKVDKSPSPINKV